MVLVFLECFDPAECKSIDSNRLWSYLVQDHDQEGRQRPKEQGCQPPKESATIFTLRESRVKIRDNVPHPTKNCAWSFIDLFPEKG